MALGSEFRGLVKDPKRSRNYSVGIMDSFVEKGTVVVMQFYLRGFNESK